MRIRTNSLWSFPILLFAIVAMASPASALQEDQQQWNRFRGPNGSGVFPSSNVATVWDAEKNLKWSIDLPGPGSSSPIVQGQKVFVTCYTGYGTDKRQPGQLENLKRHLLCFDRDSGKELWRANVDGDVKGEDPYKGFITDHGYASSTPVSDGEHVFVFFGKSGVLAYDMDGKQKWKADVGTMSDPKKWGGGASPILHGEHVIVNAGIEGHALVALNKADGSEAWKIENKNFTNNWMTPVLVDVDGHTELIYSAPEMIYGIDPNSGKELWKSKMPIKNTITASAVVHEGIVYMLGGRVGKAFAVKCGGKGDVSESHMLWQESVESSIGTPVAFGDHMYWLAGRSGVVRCVSLKDGSEVNKARVDVTGGNYASPIVLGDKLMITSRGGDTAVISATPEMEVQNVNSLAGDDSSFNGTPAVTGNQLYLRSDAKLYCIESSSK